MKKRSLISLSCAVVAVGLCIAGAACATPPQQEEPTPPQQEEPNPPQQEDPNSPEQEMPEFPDQSQFTMTVKAEKEKITVDVGGSTDALKGTKAQVVTMKPFEYLSADPFKGMSESITEGTTVGEYTVGTPATYQVSREAEGGYDNVYNKYYLVCNGEILRGPVYATEIAAETDAKPAYMDDIVSKKGVHCVDVGEAVALDASHVVLNLELSSFFYPNEAFDEQGNPVALSPAQNAFEFESNGKKFYFNKKWIDDFDIKAENAKNNGIDLILVVWVQNHNITTDNFPTKMTYYPWALEGTNILGINTSNSYGFEYWTAAMEFFASRYCGTEGSKGYASTWIIANEVDAARQSFRLAEHMPSLDRFMEEYSRLMRIANLALKQANSNVTVNTSFTHMWNNSVWETDSYAPRQMVDWLNEKTKLEGDYDWGIATHPYCFTLSTTRVFEYDTKDGRERKGMTGGFDTSTITFSNLEVLDQYFRQDRIKFNGEPRKIHLAEQGVSSTGCYGDVLDGRETNQELNEKTQAAIIAAAWYKVSQLDCIKDFDYFPVAGTGDTGVTTDFGLTYANGSRKLAFELWKNIDTQYSFQFAEPYLPYISYYDAQGNKLSYGHGIESYLDVLDIYGTGYDFSNYDYHKAMPINTGVVIPEFEDKIDLSGVVFEGASRLYTDEDSGKTLKLTAEVKGTLPAGVEVKYFDEAGNATNDPSLTGEGCKTFTAKFYQNGQEVGMRRATVSNQRMSTDRTVYRMGDPIWITVNRKQDDGKKWEKQTAWIGIYKSYADINTSPSWIWFYFDHYSDDLLHTVNLCDESIGTVNQKLTPGEYTLYMFQNYDGGKNNVVCSQKITILPDQSSYSFDYDLSGVSFPDQEFEMKEGEEAEINLKIEGTLPEGITVEYQYPKDKCKDFGDYQAIAIFKKGEEEIGRRYAVLSIVPEGRRILSTEKSEYEYGEVLNVTAYASASSADKTWWVGVYKDVPENGPFNGNYVSWYYVKDSGNSIQSGKPVDVNHFAPQGVLEPGKYTIVLFRSSNQDGIGNYTDVASTISVTVKGGTITLEVIGGAADDGEYGKDVLVFDGGAEVKVKVTLPESLTKENAEKFWVGLFPIDSKNDYVEFLNGGNCSDKRQKSLTYYYVLDEENGHHSGDVVELKDVKYNENETASDIPAGSYFIELLSHDEYLSSDYIVDSQNQRYPSYPLYGRVKIEVKPGENEKSTLELDHAGADNGENKTYNVGGTITVKVKSVYGHYPRIWVGLYKKETYDAGQLESYSAWSDYLTYGTDEHEVTISTANANGNNQCTAGDYVLVLFRDGHYWIDQTAEVISITLTAAGVGTAE